MVVSCLSVKHELQVLSISTVVVDWPNVVLAVPPARGLPILEVRVSRDGAA